MALQSSPWLVIPRTCSSPRMRLVCFPHSGGGPSSFAEWPEFCDHFGIEVVAISAPGRERRLHLEPLTDWQQLVREICKALIESGIVDDLPYAFFGHSFGAVVAYEVACHLEAELVAGQPRPMHLFASAHPAPRRVEQLRAVSKRSLHLMEDTALLEEVETFGFLPNGIERDSGLLQAVLPALRADLQMYDTYMPIPHQELLTIPITALGGEQDATVPQEYLEAWVQESSATVSSGVRLFPGGHFFVEQSRQQVLDTLKFQLEESWDRLPLSLERSAYEAPAIASSQCLHQIIADVATKKPLAEALVDDSQRLTYGEMMRRVELVAMELQVRFLSGDVGSVVGLLAPHDVTYVICQLGIWAAGGALLFLEPHFPPELCREICEQSCMRCAITNKEHAFKFEGIGSSAGTLEIDGDDEGWVLELSKLGTVAKLPCVNVEQLALLAFTSGTSGKPKTIAGSHKFITLANYVKLEHWPFEEGVTDRLGCNVMFNWEVCQPLVHGLTTFVIPENAAVDPQLFVSSLARHRISRVLTTPSLLSNILQYCSQGLEERIPDMRMWQVCGEVLPMQTVHKMQKLLPKCRIGNDYSTWETGDIAYGDPGYGAYEPSRNFAVAGIIATGRFAAIVDPETNKIVPHGCVGELYVAGHALSSGYYQQADMTAEKFTDGFTDDMRAMWPGKWYRTGDSGRFVGKPPMLEVRGRVDSTVKIRGFKVGIPVVETACVDVEGVAMCGVVPIYSAPGICDCLCCFFQPGAGHDFETAVQRMKNELPTKIPRWMMPKFFRPLPENAIAGGDTRKLDRKRLATIETLESLTATELNVQLPTEETSSQDDISSECCSGVRSIICAVWAKALGLNGNALDMEANFFDLGGHSMLASRIAAELNGDYGLPVTVLDIYSHSSLGELLNLVDPKGAAVPVSPMTRRRSSLLSSISNNVGIQGEPEAPIAITGLAGRFPGADDTDTFWQNLQMGTVSATFLSSDFLLSKGVSEEIIANKEFVPCAYMINDADKFDNVFFGIGRHEATLMDPQHRVFMEVAHSAVENAALSSKRGLSDCVVGVFAAAGIDGYMVHHLDGAPLKNTMEPGDIFLGEIGSEKDYIATRVAYFMDFSGPAMNVNSACSSALVACVQAATSIVTGSCDAAVAGASAITFPNLGYRYQEGLVASPDGFVRPFDAGAEGTVFGDAVGAVFLQRMDDVRNSPTASLCWGAVRGFAVTNDGGQKAGYAAPSPVGQSRAIISALEMMDTDPWSLSYVECHATGTRIGDGIETRGLMAAFKKVGTGPEKPVALGSVKGNIAHANCAAGITGLAKVLLMLKHREMVPTANFSKLNPKVSLEGTPFYVTQGSKWDASGRPLRAGVSSFGIGGTNAHMVIEEAASAGPVETEVQELRPLSSRMGFHIVPLSAKTVGALQLATHSLCNRFTSADISDLTVASVAYTLQAGRSAYPLRKTAVVRTDDRQTVPAELTQAAHVLQQGLPSEEELQDMAEAVKRATVAFVFPGQGSQYLRMAAGLYDKIPLFRQAVDRCCSILQAPELLAYDLRPLLFGLQGDSDQKELARPSRLQPSLFIVEYALAQMFLALGVAPVCVAGHSLGEYTAAVVGGLLSLEGALAVVAARANSTESLAVDGAMLSVVGWSDAELGEISNGKRSGLWLAGVNSPFHAVISGEVAAIDSLEKELKAQQRKCTRLHVTKAFHSGLVSEASAVLKGLGKPPETQDVLVPVASNYTGAWLSAQQLRDGAYWCNHMRGTVKWRNNAEQLMEKWAPTVVLEVGPGNALSTLTSKCVRANDTAPIFVQSMRHPKSDNIHDVEAFLGAVGQLWEAGVEINWDALHTELGGTPSLPTLLRLPTYAHERTSFWKAPERSVYVQGDPAENHTTAAATPRLPLSGVAAPSFVRFIDRDGQVPMIRAYCLPFASGSSILFAPWAQQLDSAVEVVAVELPGRGSHADERMPVSDADDETMLDALCQAILADLSGAQYVLVGCSMGGNLSMEIALRLARMKALTPLAVYIAGRKPPAIDPSTVAGITMSNEELAEYAFAPPEVANSPEFIEVVVPLLRADLELDARSEKRLGVAALAGELLAAGVGLEAYCGTSDSIAPWVDASGWERFAQVPVGVHFFPGGHEFMTEHRPLLYANWRRDAIGRLVQRRTAEVTALAAHSFAQPGASLTSGFSSEPPPTEVKTAKLPLYTVQWDSVTASRQLSTAPQVFALDLGADLTDEILSQTLQALRSGACILAKCATVSGVFSDADDPLNEEVMQCWRFVRLVQHLLDNAMSGRIIVACPTAIGGSMVAGASKAVAMEATELHVQRVFLPTEHMVESSSWLCALLDRFPEETDLWVDEGRVYAQRLAPMLEPSTTDYCLPQYGNDGQMAVYVLTGATGGLGSAVVEWMLREQRILPQQLVLLRRAASTPLAGVLSQCRVVEVSSPDDSDSLLSSALADIQGVVGLFHLAGVLDDGIVPSMTEERLRKVAAPKCGIAMALLRTATELQWPVQWFVGFSSTSSLFGYAGQTNYCAANSMLDNLATFSAAKVLPEGDRPPCRIITINWGPWGEAGMAKVGTKAYDSAVREGDTPLSTVVALRCLATALRTASQAQLATVQFCACDMEWEKSQWSSLPILKKLRVVQSPKSAKVVPETVVKTVSPRSAQRKAIEEFVEQQANGAAFSRICRKTLPQIGFDSLEMVQFRNAFNKRFSVNVPLGLVADPSRKLGNLAEELGKFVSN